MKESEDLLAAAIPPDEAELFNLAVAFNELETETKKLMVKYEQLDAHCEALAKENRELRRRLKEAE